MRSTALPCSRHTCSPPLTVVALTADRSRSWAGLKFGLPLGWRALLGVPKLSFCCRPNWPAGRIRRLPGAPTSVLRARPDWAPTPYQRIILGEATAFLVIACTLLAFFVQNYAASRTSPSRVALLMGSEPLWGALTVLWLGERLTLLGWTGRLLLVLSAWWVTRRRYRSWYMGRVGLPL